MQHPSRTDPIMHPARKNEAESSDALIVKTYVMPAMRLVVPIGDVLSATDESTTR